MTPTPRAAALLAALALAAFVVPLPVAALAALALLAATAADARAARRAPSVQRAVPFLLMSGPVSWLVGTLIVLPIAGWLLRRNQRGSV